VNVNREKGHIFILSAPSGGGKSTLCRAVRDHFPDLGYSISHTTRSPRPGEREGFDYHFISPDEFEAGIRAGRWAEWARVHGHYYGTDAGVLNESVEQGTDILLDIDVQGTRQLLKRFPDAVTIFILPPSMEALRRRLIERGTDDRRVIERRMAAAEEEIASREIYRHVVVNDRLETAAADLIAVVGRYRSGGAQGSCPPPMPTDRP